MNYLIGITGADCTRVVNLLVEEMPMLTNCFIAIRSTLEPTTVNFNIAAIYPIYMSQISVLSNSNIMIMSSSH